jgi:FkbM family methyltransferase
MNKFINALRTLRNITRKSIAGVSFIDKWKCTLVCLQFETTFLCAFSKASLKFFCRQGFLVINLVHRYSGKPCKIFLRSDNDADHFIFWEFLGGFYEPPSSASAIVDCGANIGLFALHAGLVFPNAGITCYEPDMKNYDLLRKNLAQNNIYADCVPCGVWSSKISGYFHPRKSFDGFISLEPSEFPVECDVPKIGEGTWLKMDVEGAEYEVLPVIMKNETLPNHVSLEIHDFHVRGGNLISLLQSKGYNLRIVTDESKQPMFAEVAASTNQSI